MFFFGFKESAVLCTSYLPIDEQIESEGSIVIANVGEEEGMRENMNGEWEEVTMVDWEHRSQESTHLETEAFHPSLTGCHVQGQSV